MIFSRYTKTKLINKGVDFLKETSDVNILPPAGNQLKIFFNSVYHHKIAMVCLSIIGLILAFCIIYPFTPYFDSITNDFDFIKSAPDFDSGYILGTDVNGRDVLSRLIVGTLISIKVAFLATFVSVVIGVTYGAISGYVGGTTDDIMMRIVDIMYALPTILIIIMLVVSFGRSETMIYLGIGLVEWITMARIVRGQTISIKYSEYIEAAQVTGISFGRIIFRHIIPNLIGPVVIYATLTIPEIILTESFLSFLGLGVQEPSTSLGTLVSEGAQALGTMWWLVYFPGTALIIILLAFIFLGDSLRDILDPRKL